MSDTLKTKNSRPNFSPLESLKIRGSTFFQLHRIVKNVRQDRGSLRVRVRGAVRGWELPAPHVAVPARGLPQEAAEDLLPCHVQRQTPRVQLRPEGSPEHHGDLATLHGVQLTG